MAQNLYTGSKKTKLSVNADVDLAVPKPHSPPHPEDQNPAKDVDDAQQKRDQAHEVRAGGDVILFVVPET